MTTNDVNPWSDEELAALALAADPVVALAPDAVAWDVTGASQPGLLPDWYMPTPRGVRTSRWTRNVVLVVIIGFLIIDGFGLCITSGFLSVA